MVKYFESSTIFHFTWEQVAQGFWRRYPNPNSSHVISEDTVTREIRDGKLYSKRLLTKTNPVPKWGERFISKNHVKIVEESIVDPKEKVLTTYTRNLGYTKVMSVVEKVEYKVSDENPQWTVVKRSAWIESSVFGFSRAIQAFGLDRFKKNCMKMSAGFNYVLSNMFPNSIPLKNPDVSLFSEVDKPSMARLTHAAEDFQHSLQDKAEKMKDAAKKATDLAKQKAGPMYVANQS